MVHFKNIESPVHVQFKLNQANLIKIKSLTYYINMSCFRMISRNSITGPMWVNLCHKHLMMINTGQIAHSKQSNLISSIYTNKDGIHFVNNITWTLFVM
jgi:hypothetical protein